MDPPFPWFPPEETRRIKTHHHYTGIWAIKKEGKPSFFMEFQIRSFP
jgi:hypothetical protein